MKLRQWVTLGLVLVLLLTGCSKGETPQGTQTEDLSDETVLTVNGEAVMMGELQYYIYRTAMTELYQENPDFDGDLSKVNWKKKTDSGKSLEDAILEGAIESIIGDVLAVQQGKALGVELSAGDLKTMDDSIYQLIEKYGEDGFLQNMQAMGIGSKEAYHKQYEREMLIPKIREDFAANEDKYLGEFASVIKEYRTDNRARVQHILLLSEDGKYEDPESAIKQVWEMAKNGEDFAKLMETYNEDPGATAQGYDFGPGEMVTEFEEASFALEIGAISEPVKTSYGYHIIKRLIGFGEMQKYWVSQASVGRFDDVINKSSVSEILNQIKAKQTEIQEQNKSNANKGE